MKPLSRFLFRLSGAFLLGVVGAPSLVLGAPSEPNAVPEAGDFIRYLDSETEAQELQTAVVRFRRGEQIVDLVGVVHLADPGYYDSMNAQLAQYDVVLYEMVGGEFQTRDDRTGEMDPEVAGVHAAHGIINRVLGMEYQTEGIDYDRPNFVHADVDWAEYSALMATRNQSLMTLFQRAMETAESDDAPSILTDEAAANRMLNGLVSGFASGNTAELKRSLAPLLGEAEALITQIEGDDGTVIVTERNKVVMRELGKTLKRGKRNVAIFYGAGHLPDLEKRLMEGGFSRETGVWMTAWKIEDPAPGETTGNLWQALLGDPEVVEGLMNGMQEILRQLQEGTERGR